MPSISLPGLRTVRYCRCSDLPRSLMLMSQAGVIPTLSICTLDLTAVEFIGEATLSVDGSTSCGARSEKSTIQFSSLEELPEGVPLAFIVTDVNAVSYVVGTREPRYPVVDYSQTTGKPGHDRNIRTYKITHVGAKSAVRVALAR